MVLVINKNLKINKYQQYFHFSCDEHPCKDPNLPNQTTQMIFSDSDSEDDSITKSKIEFITSLSKEDEIFKIKEKEKDKEKEKEKMSDLIIPLKDDINTSKNIISIDTTNINTKTIINTTDLDSSLESNNSNVKKVIWGLQVPKSKKNPENVSNNNVPLLMRNRVIGLENCKNENEKLFLDLNSRPEEPSVESYKNIPVEEFGAAMLRGMGWKGKGDKESSNNNGNIIKYVTRPERLGLGASEVTDICELKQRKPIEQSLGIELSKEEERKFIIGSQKKKLKSPLEIPQANVIGIDEVTPKRPKINIETGSRVIVVAGEHSGLKGYVKGESKDLEFWRIELEINGRDTMILKSKVKLYNSKTDQINPKSSDNNEAKTDRDGVLWTCPCLKVKIKSKSFANGKFYNCKGIILDVQPDKTCTIKLIDSTNTIERVPQRVLETCLPRDIDPTRPTVKYLRKEKGEEHFHAPFRVLQFDDERGRAVIQSEDDFEVVFEAHYDDICEFLNQRNI